MRVRVADHADCEEGEGHPEGEEYQEGDEALHLLLEIDR